MNMPHRPNPDNPDVEERFQFRLRTLLVVFTLLAVYCGLLKWGSPTALYILYAGSSVGSPILARRLGGKGIATLTLAGAFGAALVLGTTGFMWMHDPEVPSPHRLRMAWRVFLSFAIIGAMGGGSVGFFYGMALRRFGRKERGCNDSSTTREHQES